MKDCYGTIFPDMSKFQFGQQLAGEVFTVKIDTLGPYHRDQKLDTDMTQWQACQKCEEFLSCYNLSMAKLAFQQAVAQI